MPSRGHAALRPPSGAGVAAGRASHLGLALVMAIAALAAYWSLGHLQPAYQRAFLRHSSALPDPYSAAGPQAGAVPHRAGELSPAFSASVLAWRSEILRWARQFELDPNLIATVMQIESCGDPRALSSAGAMGLFQVMPYHFRSGQDPFDPHVNADRGLRYLADALTLSSGDVTLALAGYNGGHSQITRPASTWPDETRRYAYWGGGIMDDLEAGADHSPTLAEWIEAGGATLCQRAGQALLAKE